MADPKHPRHYDEAFKRQIVQLYENGKPAREIKDEYDISHSTLCRIPGLPVFVVSLVNYAVFPV